MAKESAYLALYLILVYFCEVILRKLESNGEENVETVQDLTVESLADIHISKFTQHEDARPTLANCSISSM